MSKIERLKEFVKNKVYDFKKSETKYKILIIVSLVLFIDFSLFLKSSLVNYMDFSKKQSNFLEKSVDYKYNLDNKDVLLNDYLKDVNLTDIKNVVFVPIEDYTTPVVIFNDEIATKLKSTYTPSALRNYEKILNEKNIKFSWTESFDDLNIKPIYQNGSFPISKFIQEKFLSILLYGVILFYLFRNMPELFGGKYEILYPKSISGSIDTLVGMEDIKKEVMQLKDMILNSEKYELYGINNLFNIIFSGPAGTGKTKLAGYLAKELNVPMVIGTGNVETGYVGGGARIIKSLFLAAYSEAKKNDNKTVLVFLDEAQVLLQKRGNSREKWADDSANELLAQLDGVRQYGDVKIIFIAASNFDDSNMTMDEAMERRFQKKIYFRLPNKTERENIIDYYLKKIDSELKSDIDSEYLSSIMSNLSGAKIETVIKEASLMSIQNSEKMDTKLITKAFEKITVGDSTRDITKSESGNRDIVVVHELGHFICDFAQYTDLSLDEIKNQMNLLKISSESLPKYKALGYVMNSEDDNLLKRKKDYEEEIISLYGGYAAEEIFFGEATSGAYNDLQKITKILEKIVIEMGMYSDLKINLNMINYKNEEQIISQLDEISKRLYSEAKDRILKNKELIEYLRKILLSDWVLTKNEVFDHISKYKKEL